MLKLKSKLIIAGMLIIGVTAFMSCEKTEFLKGDNSKQETTLVQSTNRSSNSSLGIRIRWGTHLFNHCKLSLPCGPCRGMCIRFEPRKKKLNEVLSMVDKDNGDRFVDIELVNNEQQLLMVFTEDDYGTIDDFGLEKDLTLSTDISSYFNKSAITLLEGIYPVDYSDDYPYGYSKIDVVTE